MVEPISCYLFGLFTILPPPRVPSPDGWTASFTWDEFLDLEYARAAGELGWWGTNWGDAARPREKSRWEQQAEERRMRKERERKAGPPPYREQPRYGPRGDAVDRMLSAMISFARSVRCGTRNSRVARLQM